MSKKLLEQLQKEFGIGNIVFNNGYLRTIKKDFYYLTNTDKLRFYISYYNKNVFELFIYINLRKLKEVSIFVKYYLSKVNTLTQIKLILSLYD